MTMAATIGAEQPGARRLRRYAPFLLLLGLAVAVLAPGVIAESGSGTSDAAAARIGPQASGQALEGVSE